MFYTLSMNLFRRLWQWVVRGLLILGGTVAGLLVAEGAVRIAIATRALPSIEKVRERLTQTKPFLYSEVLHPYLGFVAPPGKRTNPLGFEGPDPREKSPDGSVRVLLTGGSVALKLYQDSRDTLRKWLDRLPPYQGRDIVLFSTALPGYKQPQQFLSLAYLYSLGLSFDLVLNLDGYNDGVLPQWENAPSKVALHYPRSWPRYVAHRGHANLAQEFNGAEWEQWLQARLRHRWVHSVVARYSALALTGLNQLDQYFTRQLESRQHRVQHKWLPALRDFRIQGPANREGDKRPSLDQSVALWKQSSRQMAELAHANGSDFVHFLQPNLHAKDSKPFSPEEQTLVNQLSTRDQVTQAYQALRRAGQSLPKAGVNYFDLTPIFKEVSDTLYVDPYCHLNNKGNALLAQAIGERLVGQKDGPKRHAALE